MQTSIFLSGELLHKLYKANIGDVVDGQHREIEGSDFGEPVESQYRKVDGAFATDDNRTSLTAEGYLRRSENYILIFKDLRDGVLYYTSLPLKVAPWPESETVSGAYYYEPFATDSINEFLAVSATCHTKTVNIYTPSGGVN